jgi:hypothetical protein
VVVVLLGLGMFALAHGLLVGARSALVTATAGARLEEARVRTDEAMDRAVGRGPGPGMDSLSVGAWRAHPDTLSREYAIEIRWQRVSAEMWLVEARADYHGRRLARVTRMVWVLDPVTRLRALPATVSVGAEAVISVAGTLASRGLVEEQADEADRDMSASCTSWWDEWTDPASAPMGVALAPDSALGPLSFAPLLQAVVSPDGMRATPEARIAAGACDTSGGENWGDPTTTGPPCGSYFGLVGGEGLLSMVGGVGQGVLVVNGDVELSEDAHFFGLIIASGTLRLGGGAILEGFALALGGVQIASGAEVRRSVCRGLRALDGVRDRLPKSLQLHGALDYGPR